MNAEQIRNGWDDDEHPTSTFPEPLTERLTREVKELRAENERLRAGEDRTYCPDNVVPTPGQWLRRFNDADADMRLAVAERHLASTEAVQRNVIMRSQWGELRGRVERAESRAEAAEADLRALATEAKRWTETKPGQWSTTYPSLGSYLLREFGLDKYAGEQP